MSEELTIDLWTDLVCPFCYIGEERLRKALEAEGVTANIRIRSFELDPGMTEPVSTIDRLADRKGIERAEVEQMEGQLQQMAEAEGLTYTTDRLQGSTIPVHLLAQHATRQGNGEAFFRAVQTAYFDGTLDPFNREALLGFAEKQGIGRADAEAALEDEELLQAVREDQQIAQQLGVSGVPYALLDRKLAIPGAVSPEQFRGALRQLKEMS